MADPNAGFVCERFFCFLDADCRNRHLRFSSLAPPNDEHDALRKTDLRLVRIAVAPSFCLLMSRQQRLTAFHCKSARGNADGDVLMLNPNRQSKLRLFFPSLTSLTEIETKNAQIFLVGNNLVNKFMSRTRLRLLAKYFRLGEQKLVAWRAIRANIKRDVRKCSLIIMRKTATADTSATISSAACLSLIRLFCCSFEQHW